MSLSGEMTGQDTAATKPSNRPALYLYSGISQAGALRAHHIQLDEAKTSATHFGWRMRGSLELSKSTVRALVAAYMLLFLLATTWPVAMVFNRVEPLLLGLPFNLFVLALLISIALVVLSVLYISENRSED